MSASAIGPTLSPVLLDTCAAIWLMAGDPFSTAGQSALLAARSSESGIFVSPFTAWEVGTLASKGRLRGPLAPEAWFDTLLAIPGVRLAALSPQILLGSTALPGAPPKDPADRIVAATSRAYGYRVITRDRELLSYAQQGYIQAVEC